MEQGGASTDPALRETVRASAYQAARKGHFAEADPKLLGLWRTGEDEASRGDGVLLAGLRARSGDMAGALEVLAEAGQRTLPSTHLLDMAAAISANHPEPAEAAAALRENADAVRSPQMASLVAGLLERAERPREAILFLEVAARESPEEPVFQRELVRLFAVTARHEDLEPALRRLLELEPDDTTARLNLVRHLSNAGRPAEAVVAARIEEGLLPPAEREALAGDLLLRTGLFDHALEAYEAALKTEPELCDARYGRARALLKLERKREGDALLFALVEAPVGGAPCRISESVRLLLREGKGRAANEKRLLQMSQGKGAAADRESVRGVLRAAGVLQSDAFPATGAAP